MNGLNLKIGTLSVT